MFTVKLRVVGLSAIVGAAITAVACSGPASPPAATPAMSSATATGETRTEPATTSFVIDAAGAKARIAEGALAVDGRDGGFSKAHLPGAVRLGWEESSLPKSGRLKSPSDNHALFASRGIDPRKPLIVYGGKGTWGAEGRVFWMLEFYGASSVWFLNGGIEAWTAAGYETASGNPPEIGGDAQAAIVRSWAERTSGPGRALLPEVVHHVENGDWQYADARSKDEYAGSVIYGEPRGGRIPGACWLDYESVQDASGKLKSPEAIRALAEAAGLTPDKPIVTYCTGGVRSGLLYVALRYAGYDAKNYPGSMWEYTADPALPVEKD